MGKIIDVFFQCANKVISHANWYNDSFWGGATKFWGSIPFGLEVVNLGSGAGVHAFSYTNTPVKGENWALGPQSLVHDYNILKNYFSYLKEGGAVIITICPFSSLVSNYNKEHNFKYYTFLHPATIVNFEECERQKALKFKLNPIKENPSYCIKMTVKEAIHKVIIKIKPQQKGSMVESAKKIMQGWQNQFDIQDLSDYPSDQHLAEIASRRQLLIEMVAFCKERQLKPYIVIPVHHVSLSSLFSETFKYNYIKALTEDVGAPVLDYMNDEIGVHDGCFSTALFLNKEGAKLFTRKVIKDIGLI